MISLLAIANIVEENLVETRLSFVLNSFAAFSESPRSNDQKFGPSFEEIYRNFLNDHDIIYNKHSVSNRKQLCEEYEPFVYTDNVRLRYQLRGLLNISVGQEGSFTLDTFGAVLPSSNVEFVRVLFYGVAVLSPHNFTGDSFGSWTARYTFSDAGLYRVYVESVYRVNNSIHFFRAIDGSPFNLFVRPAGLDGALNDEQLLAAMPIKETQSASFPIIGAVNYPAVVCIDASWRPGRWLRCHHTPEPCIRTGWIWVPQARAARPAFCASYPA